jgi:hypothetical protein
MFTSTDTLANARIPIILNRNGVSKEQECLDAKRTQCCDFLIVWCVTGPFFLVFFARVQVLLAVRTYEFFFESTDHMLIYFYGIPTANIVLFIIKNRFAFNYFFHSYGKVLFFFSLFSIPQEWFCVDWFYVYRAL